MTRLTAGCLAPVLALAAACMTDTHRASRSAPVAVEVLPVEMQRTPQIVPVSGRVVAEATTAWFEGDLPEPYAADARPDRLLHVRVNATGERCLGRLREILPVAGGVRLRVTLTCERPLTEPSAAVAEWIAGERFGLFVPRSALREDAAGSHVWIVVAGRARRRDVRLGQPYLGALEIVAGLNGGERVITSAVSPLTDGQPVQAR